MKAKRLSGDAFLYAPKHQTSTERTTYWSHRLVSQNQSFRRSELIVPPLKTYCPSTKKLSGHPPFFQKGGRVQNGSLAKDHRKEFSPSIHRSAPTKQQLRHFRPIVLPLKRYYLSAQKFLAWPFFPKGGGGIKQKALPKV